MHWSKISAKSLSFLWTMTCQIDGAAKKPEILKHEKISTISSFKVTITNSVWSTVKSGHNLPLCPRVTARKVLLPSMVMSQWNVLITANKHLTELDLCDQADLSPPTISKSNLDNFPECIPKIWLSKLCGTQTEGTDYFTKCLWPWHRWCGDVMRTRDPSPV